MLKLLKQILLPQSGESYLMLLLLLLVALLEPVGLRASGPSAFYILNAKVSQDNLKKECWLAP